MELEEFERQRKEVRAIESRLGVPGSGGVPGNQGHSYVVGNCYFIRGVNYYLGRLISVTDSDLVLEQASWVADTGRFGQALKSGEFSEIEPYPDRVIIPRGSVFDACEWTHDLPRNAK